MRRGTFKEDEDVERVFLVILPEPDDKHMARTMHRVGMRASSLLTHAWNSAASSEAKAPAHPFIA